MEELEGTNTVEGLTDETPGVDAPEEGELSNDNLKPQPYLKIVVNLRGDRAMVGVQQEGTDPLVEVITILHDEAPLIEAFAAAADLLERARERWATSPRNPRYDAPPPPPRPATSAPVRRETGRRSPEPSTNRLF